MKLKYFDAHTHLNLADFKDDYHETIERALAVGVGVINSGTDKTSSLRAIEIAQEFSNKPIFATIGLHPDDSPESEFDYEFYKKLALEPKVVGIGECGLDFFRIRNDELGIKEKQKAVFEEQIKLAYEIKKPLVIHCRNAFSNLIEILIQNSKFLIPDKPGVIHFMSGTKDEAEKLLDLGFYFTFGGVITFPPKVGKCPDYEEIIKSIPIDKILSETDAPFVTPVPYRGKRNEPAYVIEVVKKLAEIKNMALDEISSQILKNSSKVFGIEI